ncbi:ubiquinone biosynthesis O-methyltransferase [Auriscalpium vulgare]|uniref:Ubiquinone biosynthesis O-methyltransferase n=1 Tax=Auriscalpium vulgare TaxID=40419 RepID=A0ACB8RSS8_9AGAM|nr:ubiquinone biosynthesis O-methyltransferase [Auriscalpium vulgare]
MHRLIAPTRILRPRVFSSARLHRHLHHDHGTSTVNAAEIAHFSRLSSLWWDEHGEFAMLHRMNPHRVDFVRAKLREVGLEEEGEGWAAARGARVLSGLDVLDVGCGGGILTESLTRLGARTLAVDASESNVAIASLHAAADPHLASSMADGALEYRHTSSEVLAQEAKRFDVVCSMEVIEHVDNPAAFLRSCAELVKPGGHLILSTISRTPLAYLTTILFAEDLLRLVAPGTHTYAKFINPSELVDFFHREGWIARVEPTRREAEVRGMVYLPWKGDWALVPRGFRSSVAETNYLFWVRKPATSL